MIGITVLLAACGSTKTEEKAEPVPPSKPIGAVVEIKAPLGLPPMPLPADNPPTAETIALGRRLYYDKTLSADGTVACASCHAPDKGFSDGSPNSSGVKGQRGNRNSPTVWNSAYSSLQFWDGRSPSLENQAEGPVQNPIEMANTLVACEMMLDQDPSYKAQFEKAYGPGRVTYEKIGKAIASFERTVLTGNSPFDKYQFGGDKKALSAAAVRGLEVFKNPAKGNCAVCHTIEKDHALFTDNKFHNIGVGVDAKGELKDIGRSKVSGNDADKGAFKTPTLRNIAQSGPYMHDGSLATLKDVVDFYVGGGSSNPHLDKNLKALKLSQTERADLIAFLESLTGETPANIGPPGGN
ncbi:MAG: c-type cytochrome [Acidobacteriia bacterium]|nr:c-type cytochrome [Terriglobia bacterium]